MLDYFVISLERTPERLDRFLALNERCGLPFNVFKAIDGASFTTDIAISNGVLAPGTEDYAPGNIGNALSHRALWISAVEGQRVTVVFEDDAVLRTDFAELLPKLLATVPGFDIAFLGYNLDAPLAVGLFPGCHIVAHHTPQYPDDDVLAAFQSSRSPVGLFRAYHAFGLAAVAISPAGAAKLLKLVFPMDNRVIAVPGLGHRVKAVGLDRMLNSFLPKLRAIACIAPLALSPNRQAESTVRPG